MEPGWYQKCLSCEDVTFLADKNGLKGTGITSEVGIFTVDVWQTQETAHQWTSDEVVSDYEMYNTVTMAVPVHCDTVDSSLERQLTTVITDQVTIACPEKKLSYRLYVILKWSETLARNKIIVAVFYYVESSDNTHMTSNKRILAYVRNVL